MNIDAYETRVGMRMESGKCEWQISKWNTKELIVCTRKERLGRTTNIFVSIYRSMEMEECALNLIKKTHALMLHLTSNSYSLRWWASILLFRTPLCSWLLLICYMVIDIHFWRLDRKGVWYIDEVQYIQLFEANIKVERD